MERKKLALKRIMKVVSWSIFRVLHIFDKQELSEKAYAQDIKPENPSESPRVTNSVIDLCCYHSVLEGMIVGRTSVKQFFMGYQRNVRI